ncbi:hypothetical protein EWE75_15025 [Sphingomonas populi]|uniref:Uncharacterized protein n=1 Tax=Sphingomonas populi TaxID=2484750 RepID=A0A4Q6XUJ4_9SPHN|nr:hypothetical protein [Sphingomonas populi]RZF63641.1 hypothetical protein EWE75_15025 [Sphingomonas populi]
MNDAQPDRLSVSRMSKTPPRAITPEEMATICRVADTLIPAGEGLLSGSAVGSFEALITRAAAILDKQFPTLVAALATLSTVPQDQLWGVLETMAAKNDPGFMTLSTVITGAYLYSEEIREQLNYPLPHRNPPDFFDAADELSSGILDPVMASDFTYIKID